MNVSKETAKFLLDQMIGSYSGHMSAIPHNPMLKGLLSAHGVEYGRGNYTEDFADFLEQAAAHIRHEAPF